LVTALVAAVALLWAGDGSQRVEVDAAPVPVITGLVLAGYLEATGVDPRRCEARCVAMRLESTPTVHRAELDAEGRFVLTGLADVDYRVEITARGNPALVLGRVDFVRPGGDELVIQADPMVLFGPEASRDPDR
jgi:hypothetical protein